MSDERRRGFGEQFQIDQIEAAKKRIDEALKRLQATIESIRMDLDIGDPQSVLQATTAMLHDVSHIVTEASGWRVIKLVLDGTYKDPTRRPGQ